MAASATSRLLEFLWTSIVVDKIESYGQARRFVGMASGLTEDDRMFLLTALRDEKNLTAFHTLFCNGACHENGGSRRRRQA